MRLPDAGHPIWTLAQQVLSLLAILLLVRHFGTEAVAGHAGLDAIDGIGGAVVLKEFVYLIHRFNRKGPS